MYRILILVVTILQIAGCVNRISDVPVVAPVNVAPQKLYIYTGGEEYGWNIASSLASDLQAAGYEPVIVANLSEVNDGQYVIEDIEPMGQCFSEPLLFVLTLGVIPNIGCEEFGNAFSLYRKGSENKKHVNAKYTVKVMAGWLAWPAAFSRDYEFSSTTPDIALSNNTPIMLLRRELQHAMQ